MFLRFYFAFLSLFLALTVACAAASPGNDPAATSPLANLSQTPGPAQAEETLEAVFEATRVATTPNATQGSSTTPSATLSPGMRFALALRAADTGRWEAHTWRGEGSEPLTVSLEESDAEIRMACVPAAGNLQVSFLRHRTDPGQVDLDLFFQDDDGEEVRYLGWRHRLDWLEGSPRYAGASGTVVLYMNAENSQAVIDALLLDGVSEMRLHYKRYNEKEASVYTLPVEGFQTAHDLLAERCRPGPSDTQAGVAASILKPPTPTPIPSPTPTPHVVTWQQEWCEEKNYPRYGIEGTFRQDGGAQGTARLVIVCRGGELVVGVHLTLQDRTYPEIDLGGIAYGFGFGSRLEVPYQHYADGWEQVRSAVSEGGVLLIPPEEAVKEILERRHASRNPNRKFLYLYLVFGVAGDDDPRMREDRDSPDVAIRIKGRVQEQSID